MDQVIEELTLLLLYLMSWEERAWPDAPPVHRAWKGFRFEVLDALEEKDLISQTHRAKSVYLTEAGVQKVQELMIKYLGASDK